MGEVYLARDSTLDRDVALKVLPQMAQDDDRVRRFILEAKSAPSLSHPHIFTQGSLNRDIIKITGLKIGAYAHSHSLDSPSLAVRDRAGPARAGSRAEDGREVRPHDRQHH